MLGFTNDSRSFMRDFFGNTFMKIDQFFFKLVEQFMNAPFYGRYIAFINKKLDEKSLEVHRWIIILISVFSPLFIVSLFFIYSNSLSNENARYIKIKQLISDIQMTEGNLKKAIPMLTSTPSLNTSAALKSSIAKIIKTYNLSGAKYSVLSFDKDDLGKSSIGKIYADLQISNLSTEGLTNLLTELIAKNKMQITGIKIKRDDISKKLLSEIQLKYFIRQ